MADKVPDNAVYWEFTKDGVTHRKIVSPEEAQAWIDGKQAIGMGRGEPMVDKDGRLIEHHGWPEDEHAETVNPVELGKPLELEDPDLDHHPHDEP